MSLLRIHRHRKRCPSLFSQFLHIDGQLGFPIMRGFIKLSTGVTFPEPVRFIEVDKTKRRLKTGIHYNEDKA